MFTIVFKYLLFFNFNNKRVRRTFSGGYFVFVGMTHPSYAITSDSSHTVPSWYVAKPHHDWIYRMVFSSSTNSEIFVKGKRFQTLSVFLFYKGFKMSFLLCIWFKSLVCFSENTSLSSSRPYSALVRKSCSTWSLFDMPTQGQGLCFSWPVSPMTCYFCVCLCKGLIQQECCELTNYKEKSFFIVPSRWMKRLKTLHEEWGKPLNTFLLCAWLKYWLYLRSGRVRVLLQWWVLTLQGREPENSTQNSVLNFLMPGMVLCL